MALDVGYGSGRYLDVEVYVKWEGRVDRADFDALVAQLARLHPPCLLFDAPDTLFPGSALHRRFYERLRTALPAYDKQGSAPAWDVRCK